MKIKFSFPNKTKILLDCFLGKGNLKTEVKQVIINGVLNHNNYKSQAIKDLSNDAYDLIELGGFRHPHLERNSLHFFRLTQENLVTTLSGADDWNIKRLSNYLRIDEEVLMPVFHAGEYFEDEANKLIQQSVKIKNDRVQQLIQKYNIK